MKSVAKTLFFIVLVQISLASPVLAQLSFKENFNGYYGDGAELKMTDPRNAAFNKRQVQFSQDVNTRVVDLATIKQFDTTGGLSTAGPISHPKIGSSDLPVRGGNISNGAMLFKYPPGTSSWAEERFSFDKAAIGKNGVSDLWVQLDIFCPTNYVDRVVDGNWGSKHMVFYADGYEDGQDPTLIIGRVTGNAAPDVGFLRGGWEVKNPLTNIWGFASNGGFDRQYDGPAIYNSGDRGKWTRQTFHIKFPSSATSSDGITEVWVRHANGTVEKQVNLQNGNFSDVKGYVNAGYLLGWSNNGFSSDTWFLLTNMIFTESKNDIDLTAITSVVTPLAPVINRVD